MSLEKTTGPTQRAWGGSEDDILVSSSLRVVQSAVVPTKSRRDCRYGLVSGVCDPYHLTQPAGLYKVFC